MFVFIIFSVFRYRVEYAINVEIFIKQLIRSTVLLIVLFFHIFINIRTNGFHYFVTRECVKLTSTLPIFETIAIEYLQDIFLFKCKYTHTFYVFFIQVFVYNRHLNFNNCVHPHKYYKRKTSCLLICHVLHKRLYQFGYFLVQE